MNKFYIGIIALVLMAFFWSECYSARVTHDLLVLYDFMEPDGSVIGDKSTVEPKLDLEITDPTKIEFLSPGILVKEATVIKTNALRTKLNATNFFTNGFTIEVWIRSANITQSGPARIVSFSQDSGNRNFTFGQAADTWNVRFRTSVNPDNGTNPSTSTPAGSLVDNLNQHVVYTRDAAGNAKMYVNKALVGTESIPGDGSNWDINYGFGLFNELNYPTDTRTWLGRLYLVAIYAAPLTAEEITSNYKAGLPPITPVVTKPKPTIDPNQRYDLSTDGCTGTPKISTTRIKDMPWDEFIETHTQSDNWVSAPAQDGADVHGLYVVADPSEVLPENLLQTITHSTSGRVIRIYKAICSSVIVTKYVSTPTCTLSVGHADYCADPLCGPCEDGEGDCDNNDECVTGLTCVQVEGTDTCQ